MLPQGLKGRDVCHEWEVVTTLEELDTLVESLNDSGTRESALLCRIMATKRDLEARLGEWVFDQGAPMRNGGRKMTMT